MYNSIYELPPQVTASLDEYSCKRWMRKYNEVCTQNPTKDSVKRAKREAWRFVKDDPTSFSFCIKASVEDIDRDGEVVDVKSIMNDMDKFIETSGNCNDEHGDYTVAHIWDWEPIKEDGMPGLKVWGNMFGGNIVFDQARRNFVNGRNNLSVAGEASGGHYQCDEKGCYVKRSMKQLMEISLCSTPANRHATLVWYNDKAKMTKSAKKSVMLSIDEYTLHKDTQFCPIQAMKKKALDAGFEDVHAREDGIFIEMGPQRAINSIPVLMQIGTHVHHMNNGVFIGDKARLLENTFKTGFSQGYVDANGQINGTIPEKVFKDLFERGLIRQNGPGFELTY